MTPQESAMRRMKHPRHWAMLACRMLALSVAALVAVVILALVSSWTWDKAIASWTFPIPLWQVLITIAGPALFTSFLILLVEYEDSCLSRRVVARAILWGVTVFILTGLARGFGVRGGPLLPNIFMFIVPAGLVAFAVEVVQWP